MDTKTARRLSQRRELLNQDTRESGAGRVIVPCKIVAIYARNQTGFVTEWTIWGNFHGRAALTVAEGRPNILPGLVKVARKRIDDYEFTNISFVKIDVEGYELEVLESTRELLAREQSALLIEIKEKHNNQPLGEAIVTIKGYGYDCFYVRTTALRHFSHFATDTEKSPTNNFVFLPVDG